MDDKEAKTRAVLAWWRANTESAAFVSAGLQDLFTQMAWMPSVTCSNGKKFRLPSLAYEQPDDGRGCLVTLISAGRTLRIIDYSRSWSVTTEIRVPRDLRP